MFKQHPIKLFCHIIHADTLSSDGYIRKHDTKTHYKKQQSDTAKKPPTCNKQQTTQQKHTTNTLIAFDDHYWPLDTHIMLIYDGSSSYRGERTTVHHVRTAEALRSRGTSRYAF